MSVLYSSCTSLARSWTGSSPSCPPRIADHASTSRHSSRRSPSSQHPVPPPRATSLRLRLRKTAAPACYASVIESACSVGWFAQRSGSVHLFRTLRRPLPADRRRDWRGQRAGGGGRGAPAPRHRQDRVLLDPRARLRFLTKRDHRDHNRPCARILGARAGHSRAQRFRRTRRHLRRRASGGG